MSVRSSMGPMLDRAAQFSEDEFGKRIPKAERNNWHAMRVKSTRAYAPAPTAVEDVAADAQRSKDESELRELLTAEENNVRDLQKLRYPHIVEEHVPVDQLNQILDEGWALVRQEAGIATVSMETHTWLTYEQIGFRLGLSPRQVHRRVMSINRKLRDTR